MNEFAIGDIVKLKDVDEDFQVQFKITWAELEESNDEVYYSHENLDISYTADELELVRKWDQ